MSCFSGCAGLIAATISTPADVVKTRIMNNPKVYRGTMDCFMSAVCIACYYDKAKRSGSQCQLSFAHQLLRVVGRHCCSMGKFK